MSGRIRTIKPELLEDAVTAGLSDSAFRLFIAMILLADDYGNLRAEAKYIEGQVYWSAVPEKAVKDSCKELESLVRFYEVRGQRYAHIRGWEKHQKVQHVGKPRVPPAPDNDSGLSHESLMNPPETLAPDLRPPTTTIDHDLSAPAAPRKRRSALPDDWTPTEADLAFAKKRQWPPAKILEESGKFSAHHRGKGSLMLDWEAAWETWVRRSKEFEPRSGPFVAEQPKGKDYPEFEFEPGELPSERRGGLKKLGGT